MATIQKAGVTMAANILLVEDEPGIQELLKFNLAQAGHQVTTAATPSTR
jgi:DNA-binding response OmpR family regulator